MKTFAGLILLAAMLAGSVASAQTEPKKKPLHFDPDEESPSPNRLSVSYRLGFNIKANLRSLGAVAASFPGSMPSSPGTATSGVNHEYDNGYNRVDSTGNLNRSGLGSETGYWGYASASQIVGDNVVMTSSHPGNLASDLEDSPHHALELTYGRELGRWGHVRYGFEVALGNTALDFNNTVTPVTATLTADAYALRGIVAPAAPYAGSFAGPGAVISDVPQRIPANVTTGFNADVVGLKIGPYFEFPITKRFSATLGVGGAAVSMNSKLTFTESVTVSGTTGIIRSVTDSRSEWLVGGYGAVSLSYEVSDSVRVVAGVQYQHVNNYTHQVSDKAVDVDLGKTFFATIGVSLSF